MFRYLQLRHFYDTEIKKELTAEICDLISIIAGAYHKLPKQVVSRLYKGLQSVTDKNTLHIKRKWEVEMDIQITEREWQTALETQHTSTNSRGWKEFGWKNLIRFFITPHIKCKLTNHNIECWRECGTSGAEDIQSPKKRTSSSWAWIRTKLSRRRMSTSIKF